MAGCDENFEEINTNPTAILKISDPGLLFTNVLRNTSVGGSWDAESTIVQHFVLPYILGATVGYQFNENVEAANGAAFGMYTGNLRTIEHLMSLIKDDEARSNMYNQTRIMRVHHYMYLVDHYGDVPYSEAEKAGSEGIFYPKYDKGSEIYDDLYKELKEATAALDASKPSSSQYDIFVAASASSATQMAFWRKFGYSLMLRMGMRYSKLDPTGTGKAKEIVQAAFTGGVMQTNADNPAILNMTGSGVGTPIVGYTNGRNGIRGANVYYYYVAKPIVDQLKSTNDPRSKFMIAYYNGKQNTAPSIIKPDVDPANQYGVPVGYSDGTLQSVKPAGYRPPKGDGLDYSQINYNVVGNSTTPSVIITNAQVKLLLAEAAKRGYIPGGDAQAAIYYYEGIDASMDGYSIYPNVAATAVSNSTTEVLALPTVAEKTAYKAQVGVVYNPATALQQINTQYWIECFNNGYEAWSNFRRSGYPALSPNLYNNNLNGGFIRRNSYPLREQTSNPVAYQEAVANLNGPDYLTTRIFWDIP